MRSWLSDCSPIKAKRVTWSWRDIGGLPHGPAVTAELINTGMPLIVSGV